MDSRHSQNRGENRPENGAEKKTGLVSPYLQRKPRELKDLAQNESSAVAGDGQAERK